MKKKLLFGIVSALLAVLMCIGFVACGGIDAKSVKGEEFPEDEKATRWAAAFDEENFTSYKMEVAVEMKDESGSGKVEITLVVAEQGIYVKFYANGEGTKVTQEIYIENVEDGVYLYAKADNGWMKQKADQQTADEMVSGMTNGLMDMLFSFTEQADNYEYSAEWKGYVVPGEEATSEAPVIKFKDGKVAALYTEVEGMKLHLVFTYGNQKVKFPKAVDLGA